VLEPTTPTALERELLTRLTGELGAAGLEVIRRPLSLGSDAATAVISEGSELAPIAAFATKETPRADEPAQSGSSLRLWLSDRVTGTVLVEDGKEVDGSSVASSLAVQGFELLQARVAIWRWRRTDAPTPAAPAPAPKPPPPVLPAPRASDELSAAMHVGLLYDAASGGTAFTPMIRLVYTPALTRSATIGVDLGARLSVAGFGEATVLAARGRQIDVVQSFALVESVVSLNSEGWLRPFGSAGAGAYRVDVDGVGSAGAVGRSVDTLSAIAAAGVGLAAYPLRHWILHVEAQGLFAFQPTAVQVGSTRAATLGLPLFVFSIGCGMAL
jgi:hypothetical protein